MTTNAGRRRRMRDARLRQTVAFDEIQSQSPVPREHLRRERRSPGGSEAHAIESKLSENLSLHDATQHGYAQKPVMFFAGDDSARRATVAALLADLGFEPVDAGPLSNARLLEPYAMLWIDLAVNRGQGRDIAFALMRRQ